MRMLTDIALEIQSEWSNISPYAEPYLTPMLYLGTIDDKYHYDDARSIVAYFLGNAGSWQGDKAREIKKELKLLLKLPVGEHARQIELAIEGSAYWTKHKNPRWT